jgi:hypothetical protein
MQRYKIAIAAAASVAGVLAPVAVHAAAVSAGTVALEPGLRLIAAQSKITVSADTSQPVALNPGIWLENLGPSLELDVRRATAAQPVTVTQVTDMPDGSVERRELPSGILDGWSGLANFLNLRVKDSKGKVVGSADVTLCPNSLNAQRAIPSSPSASPYPGECGFNPFQETGVWGIERDWAIDQADGSWPAFTIKPGDYTVTESINSRFRQLFSIPADLATASAEVTVIKASGITGAASLGVASATGSASSNRASTLLSPARQSGTTQPGIMPGDDGRLPPSALPDLEALPAWGVGTSNTGGSDLLDFAATVANVGNAPLDVEGFRSDASTVMPAYQYFYQDGQAVQRTEAGTMGFDSDPGHNHWHFQQFAEYQLLGATKKTVVSSHKVGFCIAATDPINLLLPNAVWEPGSVGLGGQCGVPTTLWVQEYLPVGWGDTYAQSLPGQAFDISKVPNGTYYIAIIANPLHQLHELTPSNDTSFREVVLGGSPGARTVCASAVNGIDPEC